MAEPAQLSLADPEPNVQREGPGLLSQLGSSIVSGGEAALKAAKFAVDIVTDPSALPRYLAEGIWSELSQEQKEAVIDKVLEASKWMVENVPMSAMGPLDFMSQIVKNGMIGFLDRAISYDKTFKVHIADRLMKLLKDPTPEFSIGFLLGFLKGLWDGVTGPFVLLWDLVKLQWKIDEMEVRLVAALADSDKRKVLVDGTTELIQRVEAIVGPALQEVLAGKSDPAAVIGLFETLVQGAVGQVQGLGGSIADALVRFLEKPDRELGEGVGWVSGSAVFEVLLLVLTDGGYTALKEAVTGVKQVAEALEAAAKIGARAEEMLAPMFAALARFKTFATTSFPAVAGAADVLEEVFNLVVKFLKLSYGLEGGAERGAAKGAKELGPAERAGEHGLAAGERGMVVSERTIINELGEEHSISVLIDGSIMRCSEKCERIAQNLLDRAGKLRPEAQETAQKLADSAAQLHQKSVDLAAQGLSDTERAAQVKPLEDEAERLERQMSLLEKREQQLEVKANQALDEQMAAIDKEIAAGTHKKTFTKAELDWLNADPRNKRLAFDPDIGTYRVQEAQDILAAEAQGVVPAPVKRSTRGGEDFVDGDGKGWSHKGTRGDATIDTAVDKATTDALAGRNCVCDLSGLSGTDARSAADEIGKALLKGPHAEVRFVPPALGRIAAMP
jgi:hypothetical protein